MLKGQRPNILKDWEILPTTSGHVTASGGDPSHKSAMSDGMGGVRPCGCHMAKRMVIGQ
jgi:hypothetical protein